MSKSNNGFFKSVAEFKSLPSIIWRSVVEFPGNLMMSIKELQNIFSLCFSAMLLALRSVLGMFAVLVIPTVKIGFSFLPTAIAGMAYGPFTAAIIGGAGDIISYFLNPTGGAYFPGFTLNGIVMGLIYGAFFYRNKITLPRVVITELLVIIFVELILSSMWLSIMFENAYFIVLSGRLIKALVMAPIDIALIMTFAKITNSAKIIKIRKK